MLACKTGAQAAAGPSARPGLSMVDVELPGIMATWDGLGGLCIAPETAAAGRVVLVASADGSVACWTLDGRAPAAQAAAASLDATRRSSGRTTASGSAQAAEPVSQGVTIARCRTLPSVPDLGILKTVITCGDAEQYAVGALQLGVRTCHAVSIRPARAGFIFAARAAH